MPRYESRCVDCGQSRLHVDASGYHPTCFACGGDTEYLWRGTVTHGIATNEAFIGGMTLENLGHDPVTVYSREEYTLAMREANVEQRIKYVPGDKHLIDWSLGMDAQTLANAKALVERTR